MDILFLIFHDYTYIETFKMVYAKKMYCFYKQKTNTKKL